MSYFTITTFHGSTEIPDIRKFLDLADARNTLNIMTDLFSLELELHLLTRMEITEYEFDYAGMTEMHRLVFLRTFHNFEE